MDTSSTSSSAAPSSPPTAESQPLPSSNSSRKIRNILLGLAGLLLLAAVGAGGYYAGNNAAPTPEPSPSVLEPSPSPSEEEGVFCTMDAKLCPDGSYVGRSGPNCEFAECPSSDSSSSPSSTETKTYQDPQGGYQFSYSTSFTLDRQNDSPYTRLITQGPTQRSNTELYDGAMITFEGVTLGNQPFEQWVDDQIAGSREHAEVIEKKTPVQLNGYAGFTYTIEGLGTFKYYLLQRTPGSRYALSISTMVSDPTSQGFADQVQAVLDSVRILK